MSAGDAAPLAIDALRQWSRRWPGARTVTLIDVGAHDDAFARTLNAHDLPIQATCAEARPAEAVDTHGAASFDYAHVGRAIEAMHPLERLTTLRAAERLGRHGLLWTGLVRAPFAGEGLGRSQILDMRKRLSMRWLRPRRLPRLGGPFLCAGEHPDAWTGLGETA
jgi:hypothetical protein